MISVYIIKNWNDLNLFRQTPRSEGVWKNIHFHDDPLKPYDYVIVYNTPSRSQFVYCRKDNVWCVIGEPPNEYFKYLYKDARKKYCKVFAPPDFQPALPWHVNKTFDELKQIEKVKKSKGLSFITSNKQIFKGHKNRMKFLDDLRKNNIKFDLYGRGFHEIKDKWEGLADYKYSLAIENYRGLNYWSEKIADCFLSYTMPIYYGCSNITDFFPKESLIQIDIDDPECINRINDVSAGNLWKKNEEAIRYARDLVLNKYQFFPYFTEKIRKEKIKGGNRVKIDLLPALVNIIERAKFLYNKIII